MGNEKDLNTKRDSYLLFFLFLIATLVAKTKASATYCYFLVPLIKIFGLLNVLGLFSHMLLKVWALKSVRIRIWQHSDRYCTHHIRQCRYLKHRTSSSISHFFTIPGDLIVEEILCHLSLADLISCLPSCHRWHEVASSTSRNSKSQYTISAVHMRNIYSENAKRCSEVV